MPSTIDLPSLPQLARRALPHVVEATLVPLLLFYGSLWLIGVWAALASALVWSYGAILRRIAGRRKVPALLVLGAAGLTVRTLIALATGSVFVYFLQPTLATVVMAGLFLVSVPAGRPLAERLARDFVLLPPEVLARSCIRRVFVRITLLWALVNLVNASLTFAFLISQPVATYVALKTVTSFAVLVAGVVVSAGWFKKTLRSHSHDEAEETNDGDAGARVPGAAWPSSSSSHHACDRGMLVA